MPKRVSSNNVYDENGKRRFHGAFTGGFSAGYYNTVGTEEGWQTTSFISTRDQRVQFKKYTKEDFMDDDDDRLAGRNLETLRIYSDKGKVTGVNKNGQRITRVEKKANVVGDITRNKRHYYGIGYVPVNRLHSNAMLLDDDRNKVLLMGNVFKNTNVNASGFGISALEDEDEDVYATNDPSQFDRVLDFSHNRIKDIEEEEDNSYRHHHNEKQADIEGFVYARHHHTGKYESEVFPPPHLPSHFHERHIFSKPLEWSWVVSKDKITSPPKVVNREFTRMTEDQIKAEQNRTLPASSMLAQKFVAAGTQVTSASSSSSNLPAKLTSIHTVDNWRPAKLLCKRFNIQDPYKNLPDVEKEEEIKNKTHLEDLMPTQTPGTKKSVAVDVGDIVKEFSDPLQNIKKADVDLFDALFS